MYHVYNGSRFPEASFDTLSVAIEFIRRKNSHTKSTIRPLVHPYSREQRRQLQAASPYIVRNDRGEQVTDKNGFVFIPLSELAACLDSLS